MDVELLKQQVQKLPSGDVLGRVSKVVGLIVESRGPEASLGEQMLIHMGGGRVITAEVVGFQGQQVLLMPIENAEGIRPGLLVEATGHQPQLPLSEALLGRVIDPLGRPLDDGPPIQPELHLPIHGQPPNPMHRRRIAEPLATGIRAIDGMLTLGKGQRIGIFSGSGVGKSTILGMIARYTSAQVNVIVLVGERGRELREFLENDLGEEGLKRSVVVVATSDQTPLLRLRCALSGTTVAEYFMRKGKDVLMMMDSVTRFAMAQREVGLSAGEPPVLPGLHALRLHPPAPAHGAGRHLRGAGFHHRHLHRAGGGRRHERAHLRRRARHPGRPRGAVPEAGHQEPLPGRGRAGQHLPAVLHPGHPRAEAAGRPRSAT